MLIMARLVVCGLLGLAAVCLAAPHKVDPKDEKGNRGHSYNVAHLGHRGPEIAPPQDSDDADHDYPGGGSYPGGGGGFFPYGSPHRSSRVRRYDSDARSRGYGQNYGHRRPYSHGPYAYQMPVAGQQSHSYSKASASASSGSGGFHG